jgi:hypothetical protein
MSSGTPAFVSATLGSNKKIYMPTTRLLYLLGLIGSVDSLLLIGSVDSLPLIGSVDYVASLARLIASIS